MKRITFQPLLIRSIFLIILAILFSRCTYYKALSSSFPASENVEELIGYQKSFVVHLGDEVRLIRDVSMHGDTIHGIFLAGEYEFPSDKNRFPNENGTSRYKVKQGDSRILREVHIYIPAYEYYLEKIDKSIELGMSLPLFSVKEIYRCDIYSHNNKASSASKFGSTFVLSLIASGVALGSLLLIWFSSWG